MKDWDSSHPHFNRHGSSQLGVLFNCTHLYHQKRCLPLVDDLKWLCSQTDDPDFSDITLSAKPRRHHYETHKQI